VPSQSPGPNAPTSCVCLPLPDQSVFRPPNLPYGVEAAPDKLQWCRVLTAQGLVLEVFNPTPYHVTFERVSMPGQRHARTAVSGAENMVIFGGAGASRYPRENLSPGAAATVEFQTLDDGHEEPPPRQRLPRMSRPP
jgi:chaperone protein EcpD